MKERFHVEEQNLPVTELGGRIRSLGLPSGYTPDRKPGYFQPVHIPYGGCILNTDLGGEYGADCQR